MTPTDHEPTARRPRSRSLRFLRPFRPFQAGSRIAPALLLAALLLPGLGLALRAADEPAAPGGTSDSNGADSASATGDLTAQEAAGRKIFLTGVSPSGGEILAGMGGGTELPAAALPCSSCHGEEGRGNPEGGVSPSNLTWEALTRPYDVETSRGRKHGPYDPSTLKRAISLGVDPAGNDLHVAMPRYSMSHEDMEALVAFIRQLGRARDPGIGDKSLRVGTLLPPPGRMGEVGESIRAVLAAWAEEVNAGGGLYGRKVELVPTTLPADPADWPDAADALLEPSGEKDGVFALLGPYIAGADEELSDLAGARQVPVIGPFTLHPKVTRPVNPWVFYLLPGLSSQGRAMVHFAIDRMKQPSKPTAGDPAVIREPGTLAPGTVLYPEDNAVLETVAQEMVEEAKAAGWDELEAKSYVAGAVDALRIASTLATFDSETIFFLGASSDRQILLQGAEHFNWRPTVYTPGAMAGPEALVTPHAFEGRFFLSFPSLPDDRSPEAAKAFSALSKSHELPRRHLATQLATLAAAKVFEEGVKRAGRDLSRAKLVDALDELYKWDTGLTPLLTFNPNRRVGARGAYIVALDLDQRTFERVGGWIDVK